MHQPEKPRVGISDPRFPQTPIFGLQTVDEIVSSVEKMIYDTVVDRGRRTNAEYRRRRGEGK